MFCPLKDIFGIPVCVFCKVARLGATGTLGLTWMLIYMYASTVFKKWGKLVLKAISILIIAACILMLWSLVAVHASIDVKSKAVKIGKSDYAKVYTRVTAPITEKERQEIEDKYFSQGETCVVVKGLIGKTKVIVVNSEYVKNIGKDDFGFDNRSRIKTRRKKQ